MAKIKEYKVAFIALKLGVTWLGKKLGQNLTQ